MMANTAGGPGLGLSLTDRLGSLGGFAQRFDAYCARADDNKLSTIQGVLGLCNKGMMRFLASGVGWKASPDGPDQSSTGPATALFSLAEKASRITLTSEMHVALLRARGPLEGARAALDRGDISTAKDCMTRALGRADSRVEAALGLQISAAAKLLSQEPPDTAGASRAIQYLLES